MPDTSQTFQRMPTTNLQAPVPPEVQERTRALALRMLQRAIGNGDCVIRNKGVNVDHSRKLYFIHNPKAMGCSMRAWLGLGEENTQHAFPSLSVSRAVWEGYTTILVVREPLQRFLSSYQFHCKSKYAGNYYKRYPDLKSLDPRTYFYRMTKHEPLVLAPQWKWAVHLESNQPVDFLIKMGAHTPQLRRLAERFDLRWPMPRINQTTSDKAVLDPALEQEIVDYYRQDYMMFGFARTSTRTPAGQPGSGIVWNR